MAATHIALLRGINVGKAKRVAMADLRALVTALGYLEVKTLLNSGNVVFTAPRGIRGSPAARIQEAIARQLGVASRVTVLTVAELSELMRKNPLRKVGGDPSRLLVGILANPADRGRLLPLASEDWAPEVLAVGTRGFYLWCAGGILASRLVARIGRLLGDAATTRNWATITKLHALAGDGN
jgi:uncharacterized protein (DUF1697 family)